MRNRIMVVTALVLALGVIAFAADDPFVGTWKLNLEKSRFTGMTPPQSHTLVIKAIDNALQEIGNTVNANGQANHSDRAYFADGKDHPVTGNPSVDAYNLARIDKHTTVYVVKKETKEITTWRNTISKDGKTLTRSLIQGQNSGRALVYDKQ